MRVLIGCKHSGIVREAFRKLGHDAWSCDIVPASDGSKYHIQDDILKNLKSRWDIGIFHPPCTYLCIANAVHYSRKKWGDDKVNKRLKNQEMAINFFSELKVAPIQKIAIENPLPLKVLTAVVGKYDQIVHPYYFGQSFSKKICLWLKNLPKLEVTNMVDPGEMIPNRKGGTNPAWSHLLPVKNREKIRSTTFQGIANAMAEQWESE